VHILLTYPWEVRFAKLVAKAIEIAGWEGAQIIKHVLKNEELRNQFALDFS